ncbi:MAG: MFS transporter [Oscillatoria sp. PMC 1051.18]|nr:MFS transporter [Oscillatoria sp. PMC 1050.18]MEC5029316.1 MFS transporter [Oscillatoria sp. PMC 1051.18]
MNFLQNFNLPLRFWIAASVAFINSVTFTIIIPIIYPYARTFGFNDFQASLLVSVFPISKFIATPVLGKLSDYFGRKPVLVVSLLGTVIANIIAAFTPWAWLLFVARIFDGLTGGNISIARAVISDTTTNEERAKAFGIFGACFRLGVVAGPTLSYIAQNLPTVPGVSSLGMSFLVASGIASIATSLILFFLPETAPPDKQENNNFSLNWHDFGFGQLLKFNLTRQFGDLFLITFLIGFSFTIFAFAFQPFLLNVLNQKEQTIAILFALIGLFGVITEIFFLEPLNQKFKIIYILGVALLARGIVFLLMPTFPEIVIFFILAAFLGVTNAFPRPLVTSILSTKTKEAEQGEILGVNTSYFSISQALGPATAGLLVDYFGYRSSFWVTGVITILAGFFAFTINPEKASKKSNN